MPGDPGVAPPDFMQFPDNIAHQLHIVGAPGPIVPDAHGRGFFLGIAIHSQYRGYGAATVLFNHLCLEFRRAGAQYMTLFTAEDNPARHIYERAGFKIHASWAGTKKKEN